MEKSHEELGCKTSENVPSEDPKVSLRLWLKPVFEREAMKDALGSAFTPPHAYDYSGSCNTS